MKLTKNQAKEIRALKAMKDEEIDLTDIPELQNPGRLIVGRCYRPIKKSLTIRIDADVLAWVKRQGTKGYQTRINWPLRTAIYSTMNYEHYPASNLDAPPNPRRRPLPPTPQPPTHHTSPPTPSTPPHSPA